MIVIGVDPHPDSHTASAIEASSGKVVDTLRVENTEEGMEELLTFDDGFSEEERQWAIEGADNPFVAPLVARLLDKEEKVTNVTPSLTSQYRARVGSKKNDTVDATNVARALLANPELPPYSSGLRQRELKEITRTRRRLSRDLKATRMSLKALPEDTRARSSLERVEAVLAEEVRELDKLAQQLVKELAPEILEVQGIREVLGSTILAEVGDIGRFTRESKFVSYCGAAPVERSSGKSKKVRVNTGGNRTMNYVLHMIAQIRLRLDPRSKELVERKVSEGKTKREALRVLKTYIARELYRILKAIYQERNLSAICS